MPHLYTSVIVDELFSLFQSFDKSLPSLRTKITDKRDRLRLTRHLRIADLGPDCKPEWTLSGLLSNQDWSLVGETTHDRDVRVQALGNQRLSVTATYFSSQEWRKLDVMLPSLDCVVIGQKDACGWSHVPVLRDFLPGDHAWISALRTDLFQVVLGLNPRVICSHNWWSCHAPVPGESDTPCKKLEKICVHHQFDTTDGPLAIVLGAESHHYLNPNFNVSAFEDQWEFLAPQKCEEMERISGAAAAVWYDQGDVEVKKRWPGTELRLHGFATHSILVDADLEARQGRALRGDDAATAWVSRQQEADMCRDAVKFFERETPKQWRGHFHVTRWEEVPPCEACGWDISQAEALGDMVMPCYP